MSCLQRVRRVIFYRARVRPSGRFLNFLHSYSHLSHMTIGILGTHRREHNKSYRDFLDKTLTLYSVSVAGSCIFNFQIYCTFKIEVVFKKKIVSLT